MSVAENLSQDLLIHTFIATSDDQVAVLAWELNYLQKELSSTKAKHHTTETARPPLLLSAPPLRPTAP